jgi:hypothetical protein
LLLALASTVVHGFGCRRDPWPKFVPSKTINVFENEVLFEALVSLGVTFRLGAYRQSARLGDKPLEDHEQRYILATESLRS